MNQKRILIVTYYYRPDTERPRAFRWCSIAEYWSQKGYQIDVICACKLGLPNLEVLNGVNVHRVGKFNLSSLKSWIVSQQNQQIKIEANSQLEGKVLVWARILTKIHAIYYGILSRLWWPDAQWNFYFSGLKKANQLIDTNDYQSLITVSYPFTDHLLGITLKKKRPQMNWVADIGDPFCWLEAEPTNNFKLYRKLNYSVERKVFALADAIRVTTKNTRDKYAQLFANSAGKIEIIPHLSPGKESAVKSFFAENNKIRLVYTGNLYRALRTPVYLLKLFSKLIEKLARLELHLFGNFLKYINYLDEYQDLINKKIFIYGVVNREVAYQAMCSADVLINIGNATSFQLPSKVVDYLSTGKPVLNIAKIESDSSSQFFSQYPASLSILESEENLKPEKLSQLLQFIEHPPKVDKQMLKELCRPFTIESISNAYECLL